MTQKFTNMLRILAAVLLLAGCAAQRAGKAVAETPGTAERALEDGNFVIELTEIFSPEGERSDLHDSALTMKKGRFEMQLDAVLFRQQPFRQLDYLNLTDDKAVLKRGKSGKDGSRRYLLSGRRVGLESELPLPPDAVSRL